MKTRLLVALVLMLHTAVMAAAAPGQATEDILAVQVTGQQQSDNPQPLSVAYREKASARFLKTLSQDVPPVQFDIKLGD